jgi:hypothetical protein
MFSAGSIRRWSQKPWLAEVLAGLGGLWYTFQLWGFAHMQESVLDEGAYLYKGYLFATGQYTPYQPYGPWTNHVPLAFLIPGAIQLIFGPGIRTGRYAAIVLAVLMLLGIWVLARRFGGRWWAVATIWALALNPAMLKAYSTAVSQGLVACMLVWSLVLVMGERRPLWQIVLGSLLAGLMAMTRINMTPVLPLLIFYIFWQHGLKAAAFSTAAAGGVVVFWHALYWPEILQVWTRLPRLLTPFLNDWRLPPGYPSSWKPDVSLEDRIASFFQAIQFNFATTIGVLATLVLWPVKGRWKNQYNFRSAVFLLALFVMLFLAHLSEALGKNYCVYCLAGYLTFFSVTGLLLVVITAQSWRQQLSVWRQGLIILLVIGISAGIGYAAFEWIGNQLYNLSVPQWLLGSLTPGYAALGAVLVNKFGLAATDLRRLLPIVFGALAGIFVLLLALVVKVLAERWAAKKGSSGVQSPGGLPAPGGQEIGRVMPSYGYWAMVTFLVIGTLLAPSVVLGGGYTTYDCSGDVLESYEAAGKHLAANIPPGSRVYWVGQLSTVPLLYVPGIQIYPAQINGDYSFLDGGEDSDLVNRFGRWNQDLAQQWVSEADYVLIEQRKFRDWLRDLMLSGDYEELPPTPPTVECRDNSPIRIFKRLP